MTDRMSDAEKIRRAVEEDCFVGDMGQLLVAEIKRLREVDANLRRAFSRDDEAVCQALGQALGYPWFADDQKNFPGATREHGVCVGEHVAATLAGEAADRIRALEAKAEKRTDMIHLMMGIAP